MVDVAGLDLHDRWTRGAPLSEEQREALRAWYDEQDRAEQSSLRREMSATPLPELRVQVLDLMTRLESVARHIHEAALANDRLRAENHMLQEQLGFSIPGRLP